jgi:hypothetical protein
MGIPIALYAVALVVRALLILLYADPAYPDAYYYVDVARALHAGQGFNLDVIWIAEVGRTIPADPNLPSPRTPLDAARIHRPGAVHVAVQGDAGRLRGRSRSRRSPPLTWAIAREPARSIVAVGAGLLVAVPALMTTFILQPTTSPVPATSSPGRSG